MSLHYYLLVLDPKFLYKHSKKGNHSKLSQKIRGTLGQTSLRDIGELNPHWRYKEEQINSFIGFFFISGKVSENSVGLFHIIDIHSNKEVHLSGVIIYHC